MYSNMENEGNQFVIFHVSGERSVYASDKNIPAYSSNYIHVPFVFLKSTEILEYKLDKKKLLRPP